MQAKQTKLQDPEISVNKNNKVLEGIKTITFASMAATRGYTDSLKKQKDEEGQKYLYTLVEKLANEKNQNNSDSIFSPRI